MRETNLHANKSTSWQATTHLLDPKAQTITYANRGRHSKLHNPHIQHIQQQPISTTNTPPSLSNSTRIFHHQPFISIDNHPCLWWSFGWKFECKQASAVDSRSHWRQGLWCTMETTVKQCLLFTKQKFNDWTTCHKMMVQSDVQYMETSIKLQEWLLWHSSRMEAVTHDCYQCFCVR